MTIKTFTEALEFRHACKLFDQDRNLSKEERDYIYDSARLAPSSFGLEHWKMLSIRNQEIKKKLQTLCWDQPQLTTCSDVVVILARTQMTSDQPYIRQQFARWGEEKLDAVLGIYSSFIDNRGSEWITAWSKHQCYLMSGILMSAAGAIGVDSCPIEGISNVNAVEDLLEIDKKNFSLAYIITLGYRASDPHQRHRLSTEEIVEYIN